MSASRAGRLPALLLAALAVAAACPSPAAQQADPASDAPPAAAQPAAPVTAQSVKAGDGIVITPYGPQYGYRDPDDPTKFVWVFLDGVTAVQGGRTLRCDTLVVILAAAPKGEGADGVAQQAPVPGTPEGGAFFRNDRLLEYFADGNVGVVEGDEIISGASAFLLDNRTGVATVVQGELLTTSRGEPLAIRYEELHRLQDGVSEMRGLQVSNCTYDHPHWHISTPRATLTPTPDGRILDTSGNTVKVGAMPVFWWPGVDMNIDKDTLLLRKLRIGSRSRYGTIIGTEWGGDASKVATGVAELFGHTGKVKADWDLEANWYSRRGFFFQPGIEYHTADSKGRFFVAYINDTATEDQFGEKVPDNRRGRIKLQHRTRIDEHQTVDFEVARQSDANFLNEYYEEEFKEGKEQETYVSYRNVVDNHAWTVLASTRLNDFDTQVEYQPNIEQHLAGEALGPVMFGDAFLTMNDFISNARLLPSDTTSDESIRNLRIGRSAELTWPLDLPNGDRVRVTAGGDLTGFEDTVSQGSDARYSGNLGAVWSRTYSGVEDAHDETWNIDGLRRIVEPYIGYFNRYALSTEPDQLLQIDDIEKEHREETVTLGIRDRIQTHQDGKVATLLDSQLELPLYPKADRDNDGNGVGNLALDTIWNPHANLFLLRDTQLHWRTTYDPIVNHYNSSYLSFSTSLGEGRRLTLSQSAVVHEFNFETIAFQWKLNEKWTAATFYQQDTKTDRRTKSGFLLRQKAHCWFIDYEVSQRNAETVQGDSEDEVRLSVSFQPVIFDAEADLTDSIGGKYP